jgi:predicted signal transduction protein with EAL and GGDEF domain
VARIGADEFVILLEDLSMDKIEAASYAESVAEKVLHLIAQPCKLDAYQHTASVSIGATLFHDHEVGVEDILKQADIAMYQAKESGRNAIRFFDLEMQNAIAHRAKMEREIRIAIESQQFELYYQIQVDQKKIPIGAEALIRWKHPELGTILPAQFIPLAEDAGLIIPIGQWVLNAACAQLKRWQQQAHTRELSIAVNVSAKQFMQQNFVENIESIVKDHAIDPAFLKLELTESMFLENIESMINKMLDLRKIGVRFELDDFGTGYSSLQYLKNCRSTS